MTDLRPADLLGYLTTAHRRERALIEGLDEEQARAPSCLPGWTRAHVLGSRLAFMRAASRQTDLALASEMADFFEGGRPARDTEIESSAQQPAGDLVRAVLQAAIGLETRWAALSSPDWQRPVVYRGQCPLQELVLAAWREAEIHRVDLNLGVRPGIWSRELCVSMFEFLTPRAPEGTRLELTEPGGETWVLGSGDRVVVCGALTDLAAWLAGRRPDGPLESSSGTLPELRRLGMPRSVR